MTVVALCSAKGAPGVTTLACTIGAAWTPARRVVIAECDPSGGDLAARFGLSPHQGMASLAVARRHRGQHGGLDPHVQHLPGGLEVLAGPVGTGAASALDRELGRGVDGLFSPNTDVIADCGRLRPDAPGQEAILRAADTVLLVLRPDVAGLAHAFSACSEIESIGRTSPSSLVLVGGGPFSVAEVEEALRARVAVVVPIDVGAAAMASGEPGARRPFRRSRLIRSARALVEELEPVEVSDEVSQSPLPTDAAVVAPRVGA